MRRFRSRPYTWWARPILWGSTWLSINLDNLGEWALRKREEQMRVLRDWRRSK